MNMMDKIGAQLMTVREYAKTPAEIETTFQKVREIGYKNMQVSGLGLIEPQELARIAKQTDSRIVCTHQPFDKITSNLESLIEDHKLYGCNYIGLGCMPTVCWENRSNLSEFIDQMNKAAEIAKKHGFDLGYHNHNFEFSKIGNDRIMDILLKEFHPHITYVYDTYWVQHGGGDVLQWMEKLAGKIKMLHLKDMAMEGRTTQYMTEIYEGNINFDGVFRVGEEIGVEYYLVEQDTCRQNPFDSLKLSYDNIKKRLAE